MAYFTLLDLDVNNIDDIELNRPINIWHNSELNRYIENF